MNGAVLWRPRASSPVPGAELLYSVKWVRIQARINRGGTARHIISLVPMGRGFLLPDLQLGGPVRIKLGGTAGFSRPYWGRDFCFSGAGTLEGGIQAT